MIWEPFVLALVLGLIVAVGLYVAYLWPPDDGPGEACPDPSEPPPANPAAGGAASSPP